MSNQDSKLLHALEEYKDGVHETIEFSAASYEEYYRDVLMNLREMEVEWPKLLDRIRTQIYQTGR